MSARKLPTYEAFEHPLLDEPYMLSKKINSLHFIENLNFKSLPGDVFVCAYPKCGTTWTLYALYMMRNGGKTLESGEILGLITPWLELHGKDKIEAIKERPRIIKTRVYVELLDWNTDAKYIFIARNPKDCFTSFYFHTVGFEKVFDFADGKFEDFFDLAINGKVANGDYFKCVAGWFERSKTHSNVHFQLYEDMKENAEREFSKMAEFIGPELLDKVEANDQELLKKIVEESSFRAMKKISKNLVECKRPDHLPFVRKGIIGDWKNYFTKEQSDMVDEKMKEYGKKYKGFDHIWDKYSQHLSM